MGKIILILFERTETKMSKRQIYSIKAREILDSRGKPTVESVVILNDGSAGRASAPSGASTGKYEVPELRDNDPTRYLGQGTLEAVRQVNKIIAPALCGKTISCQQEIDHILLSLHDPQNGRPLGSNATLSVSLACAKAAAVSYCLPLYRYLGGANANTLPVPMMNILNGGVHADNNLDIQEFMIIPSSELPFPQALEHCCRLYQRLKELLKEKGLSTAVGDEGGFAPNLPSAEEALNLIMQAIERANLCPGKDITIGIDAAASEWVCSPCDENSIGTRYVLPKSALSHTTDELISYWEGLCCKYPIRSLEDPLGENDWQGFTQITHRLGNRVQIVGDDLFVTNPQRIQDGIDMKAANAVLIKPNQIGTLSQTIQAVQLAKKAGFRTILSHRSGETEDSIIADLAVALRAEMIKSGAPCRGERTAKYNQLLRIFESIS